jgi:hypothetical protein
MSANVSFGEKIVFCTAFLAIDFGKYTKEGVCLTPRVYFNVNV